VQSINEECSKCELHELPFIINPESIHLRRRASNIIDIETIASVDGSGTMPSVI